MILPRPRGLALPFAGGSSPATPPREDNMCLPQSRDRVHTVFKLTWRTCYYGQDIGGKNETHLGLPHPNQHQGNSPQVL